MADARDVILSRRAKFIAAALAAAGMAAGGSSPDAGGDASADTGPSDASVAAPSPPPAFSSLPESKQSLVRLLMREAAASQTEGRHENALSQLEHARSLYDHPKVYAAMAKSYEAMGDMLRALETNERSLARDESADSRAHTESEIARLARIVAVSYVKVTVVAPPDTRVVAGSKVLEGRGPHWVLRTIPRVSVTRGAAITEVALEVDAGADVTLDLSDAPFSAPQPCLQPWPQPCLAPTLKRPGCDCHVVGKK